MEDLGRLELGPQLRRDGPGRRFVDAGEPVVRDDRLVLTLPVGRGAVGVEVVEQASGLVFLDVQTGEAEQSTAVVPGIDDLGLDAHVGAVEVRRHRELVDVEAERVEPADPLVDPPAFPGIEPLVARELLPQAAVALDDLLGDLDRVQPLGEEAARLEVHHLPGDVDPGQVEVVLALAVAEPIVQLAGLGVDEVGRPGSGVPAEERVGEGDVPPEEALEVQPGEQDGQRVGEAGRRPGPEVLAEEHAVGEGELQVPGHKARVEGLPVDVGAAADDGERLHRRQVQSAQRAQQPVLATGEVGGDLLDGDDPAGEVGEAYDVPGDAPGEGREDVRWPLGEGRRPGQVEQGRVGPSGGDVQRHGDLPSRSGRPTGRPGRRAPRRSPRRGSGPRCRRGRP